MLKYQSLFQSTAPNSKCVDSCIGRRIDMCADMCIGMCAGMCLDMCADNAHVCEPMYKHTNRHGYRHVHGRAPQICWIWRQRWPTDM